MRQLVDKSLENYATAHSSAPSSNLRDLEERTHADCTDPQMLVGALEGALLRFIVGISAARRILEIGTFTGYSALTMAEALPKDGEIITCDINEDTMKLAQTYFDRSPHGKKITIRLGPALNTMATIRGPFDLIFIDADKENYVAYYEASLELLRVGGLLVADNVLWSGKVLAPVEETDHALVAFNERVQQDERVENVLLTVRDGVMLVRKRCD